MRKTSHECNFYYRFLKDPVTEMAMIEVSLLTGFAANKYSLEKVRDTEDRERNSE